MKNNTKTIARKLNRQIALSFATGRILSPNKIRLMAARVESLNRQINRRTVEMITLKEQLKPLVKFGHTRVDGFDIQKIHVRGHHVQPYYCKAYNSIHVERL